jgi:ATP-dependent DNA helicase RecQ
LAIDGWRVLAQLAGARISLFADGEAYCISEWGHNFRPDYLKLAERARELAAERVLALTATATPVVVADIRGCRPARAEGLAARPYHAGMSAEERVAVQEWWSRSPDAIVVATIASGMGIDKADVRYVYHYNLPKSLASYSQEIGRSGLDSEEGICELFACPNDVPALENIAYGDTPTPEALAG